MSSPQDLVNVRYMVDDVQAAIDFYTGHLGFTLRFSAAPAFADVTRDGLRLLLAGPKSSAGRPMPDGRRPEPGGWNRIHFIVPDIAAEVARLRAEGVHFRNDIITGPGGKQILIEDPAGNVVELFEPAASYPPSPPAQSLSSSRALDNDSTTTLTGCLPPRCQPIGAANRA